MPFLTPNQQSQSTESTSKHWRHLLIRRTIKAGWTSSSVGGVWDSRVQARRSWDSSRWSTRRRRCRPTTSCTQTDIHRLQQAEHQTTETHRHRQLTGKTERHVRCEWEVRDGGCRSGVDVPGPSVTSATDVFFFRATHQHTSSLHHMPTSITFS